MKKSASIILLVCIVTALLCFNVAAEDEISVFDYTVDGVEYTVTFEGGYISPAKMQLIAEESIGLRTGDLSAFATNGCTVHSLTTSTSEKKVHKVYESKPRCLKKIYQIVSCTKCDYYVKTLVDQYSFDCCPED